MTAEASDGPTLVEPLVAGLALVVAGIVAAGTIVVEVSVTIGGFETISLLAGGFALVLIVWGLRLATRGIYRRGVGALSGGAGFVMVFLGPQAQSEPLFVGTGALILLLAGLFLIAEGLGYELVEVDDTGEESPPVDTEAESAAEPDT